MNRIYHTLVLALVASVLAVTTTACPKEDDGVPDAEDGSTQGHVVESVAPEPGRSGYPTVEIVGYVLECMKENGGQTLENMYSCVCRFDKLASLISFDDYEHAVTQRRFLRMPGERGGMFRESDEIRDMVKDFENTLAEADKACPVVKRSGITTPAQP